jgi:hypothetical protein
VRRAEARQVEAMNRRARLTAGLGLPMLKQLRNGETDVFRDLAQKSRCNVAT